MRAPHARVPVAVLLVAVFLQAAFGVLVTCHVVESADARADGIERVAVAAPLLGGASCPGCVPEPVQPSAPGTADGAAGPGAADSAAGARAADSAAGPGGADTAAGAGGADAAAGARAADTAAGPMAADATDGPGAAVATAGSDGSSSGPCDPDRHGGATHTRVATGSAGGRASDTAAGQATFVRTSPVVVAGFGPAPAPANPSGPVHPLALRGPVATLCVDRN